MKALNDFKSSGNATFEFSALHRELFASAMVWHRCWMQNTQNAKLQNARSQTNINQKWWGASMHLYSLYAAIIQWVLTPGQYYEDENLFDKMYINNTFWS